MTKSQADLFASLARSFSTERLSTYRRPSESDGLVLARYLWNVELCEALYPVLHALEVALRNSMHDAISVACGRNDWYDIVPLILQQDDVDRVVAAKRELAKQASRKKIPLARFQTPGRVVAELNFGFWTSLLSRSYESHDPVHPRLWPRLFLSVFPKARKLGRHRAAARFNGLRHLRNRASHHEPIWSDPHIMQRHAELLEAMGWINPDL